MTAQQWDDLSRRLEEALESPDPEGCVSAAGDPELAELFKWHRRAGDFLESQAAPANPWEGRRIQGRYRLERVLGRGGAGVVFLARDERVAGHQVVVKLLHDFWSSEDWMRRRFREEAAVLGRLDHPGIVSLIDMGESDDGRLFLVLPFHEGRTLRDALRAAPLDTPFAARVLRETGDAVRYAHEQGILHRDLKPENILLVRRSDGEHPLLIDFGIAQNAPPGQAPQTTTHLMGSVAYMAPEHLMGKAVAASDTYSLAVIMWEALTGAHPFDSSSPFALPDLQRRGIGDAFYRLRPDLSTRVGKLLACALAFDPAKRPAPVTAFTQELADTLMAGAVDSRLARLWVLRRSRRWMLTGGSVALLGAGGGGWWLRERFTPLSPGEQVIDFPQGYQAEMAGFEIHLQVTERAIREFPGGRISAMRYSSPDQGQLCKRLLPRQRQEAFRRGWKIAASFRPETGYSVIGIACGHFAPRFDVGFQVTGQRVEMIATKQLRQGWDGIHAAVTLPPPPALVRVEMTYDPARAAADVSLDGKTVIRGYSGHTEFRDDLGVYFGFGSIDGSPGSAIFGGLRFEIL